MAVKSLNDTELLTAYLNALADGDKKLLNKLEKEMLKRNQKD